MVNFQLVNDIMLLSIQSNKEEILVMGMSKEEQKWRAHDDACTLKEADLIKRDPARLRAAQLEAVKMVEEQEENIKTLKKIARAIKKR